MKLQTLYSFSAVYLLLMCIYAAEAINTFLHRPYKNIMRYWNTIFANMILFRNELINYE